MRGLSFVRRFGGKEYMVSSRGHTKGAARSKAKTLRRHGLLARVAKDPAGGYCVYSGSVPAKYYRRK